MSNLKNFYSIIQGIHIEKFFTQVIALDEYYEESICLQILFYYGSKVQCSFCMIGTIFALIFPSYLNVGNN